MNKEFIPYEEALALKELGFDELTLAKYHIESDLVNHHPIITVSSVGGHHNKYESIISAPLYQQAFRWFREKYDLHYQIEYMDDVLIYGYLITDVFTNTELEEKYKFTYEEAELACLRKLIEIAKNK